MKLTIHQPNFLPYLGFFDKCDCAEVLVLYDDTQFKKNDFQNRNKIRTKSAWKWMTIPVSYPFGAEINKVKIDNTQNWKNKHLEYLRENYSDSKFYRVYIKKIKEIYGKDWTYLYDFNVELIKWILVELGIKTKVFLSSELDIKTKSSQAILDICKKFDTTEYISGTDGNKYLERGLFDNAGIKLLFQDYRHPLYNQTFEGFEPFMSILDLLFNEGSNSLNIIKSGRRYTT